MPNEVELKDVLWQFPGVRRWATEGVVDVTIYGRIDGVSAGAGEGVTTQEYLPDRPRYLFVTPGGTPTPSDAELMDRSAALADHFAAEAHTRPADPGQYEGRAEVTFHSDDGARSVASATPAEIWAAVADKCRERAAELRGSE